MGKIKIETIVSDMKILLISTNTATSPYPVFPLGCGIIANVLNDAGHNVRLFDVMAESEGKRPLDEVLEMLRCEVRRFQPELLAISIRNTGYGLVAVFVDINKIFISLTIVAILIFPICKKRNFIRF